MTLDEVSDFITKIIRSQNITATKIARRIEVAPSTITRALNKEGGLSLSVMDKLIHEYGIEPDRKVLSEIDEPDKWLAKAGFVNQKTKANLKYYYNSGDDFLSLGIGRNSLICVDCDDKQYKDNDILYCAKSPNLRLYKMPFLITSTSNLYNQKPALLDDMNKVIGRVIWVVMVA